jgi:hypothetical protein
MLSRLFGVTIALTLFSGAALADASYSCMFRNIPNGSAEFPAPARTDFIKLAELTGDAPAAYWTPFANLGAETQPLVVTDVLVFRCPNCFEVLAQTAGESQVTFFKISIEQNFSSGTIESQVWYRMNVGGPTEWVPFNKEPGVCQLD